MSHEKNFAQFHSLCLQGKCKEALTVARRVDTKALTKKQLKALRTFNERFSVSAPKANGGRNQITILISFFESYWHNSLLSLQKERSATSQLSKDIFSWLKEYRGVSSKRGDIQTACRLLKSEIEKMGLFCITGKVGHIYELEIWRQQKKKKYKVQLLNKKQSVTVFFMTDFLTRGWISYATGGLSYPGGWAKPEGLYCNQSTYDLNSEKFRVSYLTHEAQHQHDMKKSPKMSGPDLEYRAKLAELSFSRRTTRSLVRNFSSNAASNISSPHAYANFCVIRDLEKKLRVLSGSELLLAQKRAAINSAARDLLQLASQANNSRGEKIMKRSLSTRRSR